MQTRFPFYYLFLSPTPSISLTYRNEHTRTKDGEKDNCLKNSFNAPLNFAMGMRYTHQHHSTYIYWILVTSSQSTNSKL